MKSKGGAWGRRRWEGEQEQREGNKGKGEQDNAKNSQTIQKHLSAAAAN